MFWLLVALYVSCIGACVCVKDMLGPDAVGYDYPEYRGDE